MEFRTFFIAILLAAAFIQLSAAEDRIKYSGLRLDLSALSLNRDIVYVLNKTIQRTMHANYTVCKDTRGSAHLSIYAIDIISCGAVGSKFVTNSYKYTKPVYFMSGNPGAIIASFRFQYLLVNGSSKINGKGYANIYPIRPDIAVTWTKPHPEVRLPDVWTVDSVKVDTPKLAEWIQSLLEDSFAPQYRLMARGSMKEFGKVLLEKYLKINSQLPSDKVELLFTNALLDFKPTVSGTHFSLAFHTNMTANDYIKQGVERTMDVEVESRNRDVRVCVPIELIPISMEVLSKSGYFDSFEVKTKDWGFATNKMSELFAIYPDLKKRYEANDMFQIACQGSRFDTFKSYYPRKEFSRPIYCFMTAERTGEGFMIIDSYIHTYYEAKIRDEAFYGHAIYTKADNVTVTPPLSADKMALFRPHAEMYAESFHDTAIPAPALKVVPLRSAELGDAAFYFRDNGEVCAEWVEKAKVSANKQ